MEIGDMVTLSEDREGFGYRGDPVRVIAILENPHWDFTVENADGEEIDVMDDEVLEQALIFQP